MGADLAFLLPMTFVIIIVVLLFIYLCTRNSRPKGLFAFNWDDVRYFFMGPAKEEVVIRDIQDEESGRTRSSRRAKVVEVVDIQDEESQRTRSSKRGAVVDIQDDS
ncbi:hypothetical protein TWF696_001816 [Orbilia brochopaga]|uniref:Uncharacterized protein n=1 Tax=Orbilia brochopaga TaxID=3140254 RepID=A0AAV9U660_9PEZI